jgi:hypothetical protein
MPNDAKLGLVVGVAVVIAISVVFFRKAPGLSGPRGAEPAAAAVGANSVPASPTHSLSHPFKDE